VASGATAEGRIELRDILRLVEDDLAGVETLLEQRSLSTVGLLSETAAYIRAGGGKRIRPALLLLSAGLCGYHGERARLFGAVVEFIHTASLLHDDIIDDADLRRGRRTVNSRWGDEVTILLGDYLYAQSVATALEPQNLPILRVLSDATLRLIEGEVLEIERRADPDVTPEQHIDLMRRKTGDLFAACSRIGGLLGGVDQRREEALASYGLNLGIAFQMVDDLLDFTGDENALGKPVASDLREGKLTLPAIFLLRCANEAAAAKVRAVVADRGFSRVRCEEIVELARAEGAVSEARRWAERYARAAQADLGVFEGSPYKEALAALPDFILAREY
jgi:octaprenyl-diphosphate synthase